MLEHISNIREIQPGYLQSYFITDTCEILLNRIRAGTKLERHSHPLAQFGYCFQGQFLFLVENEPLYLKAGDSYDLLPGVAHGAEIREEILTLDFKYAARSRGDAGDRLIALQVLQDDDGIQRYTAPGMQVTRITKSGYPGDARAAISTQGTVFLISQKQTKLVVNKYACEIAPPGIYKVGSGTAGALEVKAELEDDACIMILEARGQGGLA